MNCLRPLLGWGCITHDIYWQTGGTAEGAAYQGACLLMTGFTQTHLNELLLQH